MEKPNKFLRQLNPVYDLERVPHWLDSSKKGIGKYLTETASLYGKHLLRGAVYGPLALGIIAYNNGQNISEHMLLGTWTGPIMDLCQFLVRFGHANPPPLND